MTRLEIRLTGGDGISAPITLPGDGGCGIINTEEAGTLVFSGVPAFFVTIVLLVQCSTAYNVHHFEPLFHQFHGGFQFVQSLMIIDPVSRVFGHMTH